MSIRSAALVPPVGRTVRPRTVVRTAHLRQSPFWATSDGIACGACQPVPESRGAGDSGAKQMRRGFRGRVAGALAALLLTVTALVAFNVGTTEPPAGAAVLSPGFAMSTVFSGLTLPTAFRFA